MVEELPPQLFRRDGLDFIVEIPIKDLTTQEVVILTKEEEPPTGNKLSIPQVSETIKQLVQHENKETLDLSPNEKKLIMAIYLTKEGKSDLAIKLLISDKTMEQSGYSLTPQIVRDYCSQYLTDEFKEIKKYLIFKLFDKEQYTIASTYFGKSSSSITNLLEEKIKILMSSNIEKKLFSIVPSLGTAFVFYNYFQNSVINANVSLTDWVTNTFANETILIPAVSIAIAAILAILLILMHIIADKPITPTNHLVGLDGLKRQMAPFLPSAEKTLRNVYSSL